MEASTIQAHTWTKMVLHEPKVNFLSRPIRSRILDATATKENIAFRDVVVALDIIINENRLLIELLDRLGLCRAIGPT